MQSIDTPTIDEAVAAAQTLVASDETSRTAYIHRLRQADELTRTVRGLNHLLARPEHHPLGLEALRRVGLEYGG